MTYFYERGACMKQIKILLWFDVEDYVTPESDDAFFELLKMLDETGVCATLKFCTKKVALLKERGREDILRLLGRHELCFHTTNHSVHPLPTEYLDHYGFRDGVEEFYRREISGFNQLSDLVGKNLCSYGHPGVSWAPQAFAAVRKMGVTTYMDVHPVLDINGGMFWYDGICSMTALVNLMHSKHETNQVELLKKQFDSIDTNGKDVVFVSIYDHPTELVTTEFWDEVNFGKGKNPAVLQPAPLRAPGEGKANIEALKALIYYTRTKENVEYITSVEAMQYIKCRVRPLTAKDIKEYASGFDGGVTFAELAGGMLAPSELLTLMAKYATGKMLVPELLYGPEEDEPSIVCEETFAVADLAEAVLNQFDTVMGYRQLKSLYRVGKSLLNPLDIYAMLATACSTGEHTVPVHHGELTAARYVDESYQWGGNWVLFADDFKAKNIMKHTKLQCWTLKPAVV